MALDVAIVNTVISGPLSSSKPAKNPAAHVLRLAARPQEYRQRFQAPGHPPAIGQWCPLRLLRRPEVTRHALLNWTPRAHQNNLAGRPARTSGNYRGDRLKAAPQNL